MAYNGSYNVAFSPSMSHSETFPNSLLTSSISSLSTTASRHPSPVSKTYRQASTLFLTRRLPEALSTLLPIITPPNSADYGEIAPVTTSSRSTRIKVWSLYLTIMNAIVELEPEEGKDAFGNQEWRALCAKVRDGAVWQEVAQNGYHGVEGDVDADVVINLATLLLAHARDQSFNQKMLENYLASSNIPNLDLNDRFNGSPSRRYRSPAKAASGANTPRDLAARVKLLELYTLHVLPQNNEWEYAREFINVSAVLDEEHREAFLQALQSLQEEQEEQERLEQEERQRQEEQLQKDISEAKRLKTENEEKERRRIAEDRLRRDREEQQRREPSEGSEGDFGIEPQSFSGIGRAKPPGSPPHGITRPPRPTSKPRPKNKSATAGPMTLTARASLVVTRLRTLVDQIAVTLNHNPAVIMRLMAFIMGLLIFLGHKGTRERIQQILGSSWTKVKATVGMGTKVSYI